MIFPNEITCKDTECLLGESNEIRCFLKCQNLTIKVMINKTYVSFLNKNLFQMSQLVFDIDQFESWINGVAFNFTYLTLKCSNIKHKSLKLSRHDFSPFF